MKKAFLIALGFVMITFVSCTKGGEEDSDPDCENDNTTTVTVRNTGTQPLKVAVANQLTPQYQAINPAIEMTLAPGQSSTKVIPSGRYMIVWWNNCATTCNKYTSYAETYENCGTYEESKGI